MKYNRKTFLDKNKQKELIQKSLKERAYIQGNIPITGRSFQNYSMNIFPDINESKLINYCKTKDYLDIACGINHLYPESFIRKLSGDKKKHGLDIHGKNLKIEKIHYYKGSIYKTNFSDNSYDCITINNFLYFWEYNIKKLIHIYKELYRILKKKVKFESFQYFLVIIH